MTEANRSSGSVSSEPIREHGDAVTEAEQAAIDQITVALSPAAG